MEKWTKRGPGWWYSPIRIPALGREKWLIWYFHFTWLSFQSPDCQQKVNSLKVLLAEPESLSPFIPSLPQSCRAQFLQAVIFILPCAATSHWDSFLGCVYHKYPPRDVHSGSDHLKGRNPLLRVSADRKVRKISPCFSTINLAKPISRLLPQCSDMIMAQRLLRRD